MRDGPDRVGKAIRALALSGIEQDPVRYHYEKLTKMGPDRSDSGDTVVGRNSELPIDGKEYSLKDRLWQARKLPRSAYKKSDPAPRGAALARSVGLGGPPAAPQTP